MLSSTGDNVVESIMLHECLCVYDKNSLCMLKTYDARNVSYHKSAASSLNVDITNLRSAGETLSSQCVLATAC